MPKSTSRKKRSPKRVLALPDLEQAKTAVLNSLTSALGDRSRVTLRTTPPPRACGPREGGVAGLPRGADRNRLGRGSPSRRPVTDRFVAVFSKSASGIRAASPPGFD